MPIRRTRCSFHTMVQRHRRGRRSRCDDGYVPVCPRCHRLTGVEEEQLRHSKVRWSRRFFPVRLAGSSPHVMIKSLGGRSAQAIIVVQASQDRRRDNTVRWWHLMPAGAVTRASVNPGPISVSRSAWRESGPTESDTSGRVFSRERRLQRRCRTARRDEDVASGPRMDAALASCYGVLGRFLSCFLCSSCFCFFTCCCLPFSLSFLPPLSPMPAPFSPL